MRQEVNLYTDEFVPKVQWCSFFHAFISGVVFLFFTGFYSFNQYQEYSSLKKINITLVEKTKGLEEDGVSDGLIDRIIEKRELLEQQVSSLSKEVENKKKIKGLYETEKNIRLSSFHDIFLTIANRSNNNLSVSEVGIYNGGEEVIVNGLSRKREEIPDYFTKLKDDPSFDRVNFGLLKIFHVEKKGLYQFLMNRKKSLKNSIDVLPKNGKSKKISDLIKGGNHSG